MRSTFTPQDIEEIIRSKNSKEHEQLEFKEAKNNFNDSDRSDYCAAISNAGGGKLLFGVSNDGKIVGTSVYHGTVQKVAHEIYQALKIIVKVEEVNHTDGRVIIFDIPPHPFATAVKSNGKYSYPMRVGDSLIEMSAEEFRRITDELQTDYTAEVVRNLNLSDLDPSAIDVFRKKCSEHSDNKAYLSQSDEEILKSANLLTNKGLTRAALILFGTEKSLGTYLACSEIIFEWRQIPGKIAHDFRRDALSGWRKSAILLIDDFWKTLSDRNLRFPFQEGFFQREIWAFNEEVVREAILNAITHRDYHIAGGRIFIKASPEGLQIKSPGGFPLGITKENIIKEHQARNGLLAETFQRIGLVERAGQGMDKIFRKCIEEGKGAPNFDDTSDYSVVLNIPSTLQDARFVKFLENISNKHQVPLSLGEIMELEQIRLNKGLKKISNQKKFLDHGIVDKVGHGRGTRYILAHHYYEYVGKTVEYTKLKGLGRNQKKELILNHIRKNGKISSGEIQEGFRELTVIDVNNLLQELKKDGKIQRVGPKRTGFWVLK